MRLACAACAESISRGMEALADFINSQLKLPFRHCVLRAELEEIK